MVTVKDVILTVEPAVIAVVLKLRSEPDVPHSPSATSSAPVPVARIRKYPAVPVASADVSDVMADAVSRPPGLASVAAPNIGSDAVSVASSVPVAAVSGSAGWAPVLMSIAAAVEPMFTWSSNESAKALAATFEILKLLAIAVLPF